MSKIKSKQIIDLSTSITSTINSTSINALSDVNTNAPTNGQALTYNSSSTKWENATLSSSSAVTFLSDITTNSATISLTNSNSMVLIKNGSTAVTIYLPLISGQNGKVLRVKRLGSALVTLAVNASDTNKYIDASPTTSVQLGVQYGSYDLVANEADGMWYLI